MGRFALAAFSLGLVVAACAPLEVGERVGGSLNRASVNTGRAIAGVGDRAGEVLQNAGSNLRDAVSPRYSDPRYTDPLYDDPRYDGPRDPEPAYADPANAPPPYGSYGQPAPYRSRDDQPREPAMAVPPPRPFDRSMGY